MYLEKCGLEKVPISHLLGSSQVEVVSNQKCFAAFWVFLEDIYFSEVKPKSMSFREQLQH